MSASLVELFREIEPPRRSTDNGNRLYSVREVPGLASYFVGVDVLSRAALLVATDVGRRNRPAPIRLARLDVRFDIPCHIKRKATAVERRRFTVMRCLDQDADTVEYFLSVCDAIVHMLGDCPTPTQIRSAVHRLVSIFQRTHTPSRAAVNGLFGELYVISRSRSPRRLLAAWRDDTAARFDFVENEARLEVKTTTRRIRSHVFSYEQCNPPVGTVAVIASMQVERVSRGLTLKSVVEEVGERVGRRTDLALKLHEIVAATLGGRLSSAMAVAFDEALIRGSLRYYDLSVLPAIRGRLPNGVSSVLFRVDLSSVKDIALGSLTKGQTFWRELPPSSTE